MHDLVGSQVAETTTRPGRSPLLNCGEAREPATRGGKAPAAAAGVLFPDGAQSAEGGSASRATVLAAGVARPGDTLPRLEGSRVAGARGAAMVNLSRSIGWWDAAAAAATKSNQAP